MNEEEGTEDLPEDPDRDIASEPVEKVREFSDLSSQKAGTCEAKVSLDPEQLAALTEEIAKKNCFLESQESDFAAMKREYSGDIKETKEELHGLVEGYRTRVKTLGLPGVWGFEWDRQIKWFLPDDENRAMMGPYPVSDDDKQAEFEPNVAEVMHFRPAKLEDAESPEIITSGSEAAEAAVASVSEATPSVTNCEECGLPTFTTTLNTHEGAEICWACLKKLGVVTTEPEIADAGEIVYDPTEEA